MDSDIAKSLPDLALIVRRDGIILSCVGGQAVRRLEASEEEIPGRNVDTLWPESIATHVLQTVRRILKTRKPAQQRYQDGDLKLEMRFQVQGFDRVLVVCRDLGEGATSNDSGLYPQGASAMLPHRDGFEKSLRMALDMAALREDTVGVALVHIGGYVTYQRVFDSSLANRLLESAAKVIAENLPEARTSLPRIARVSDDVIGVVLTDIRSRGDADAAVEKHRQGVATPGRSRRPDFPARTADRRDALGHRWRARHRAHRTRAHHARLGPRARVEQRAVTFYSDTLRLASLTRLDWQTGAHAGAAEGRARAALPAAFLLSTREIVAVEAFLRWPHKIRGMVPTSEFLPIAELSGLSVQLGRWVLRRACRDLAVLAERGFPQIRVSVNVGRQYLSAESLAEDVANSAKEAGIEPSQLDLEITEQMLSTGRSRPRRPAPVARPGRARAHRRLRHRLRLARQAAQLAARWNHDRPLVRRGGGPRSRSARGVPRGHRVGPCIRTAHRRRRHRDRSAGAVPDRRTVPRRTGPSFLRGDAARQPVGQNIARPEKKRQLLSNAPSAR